MSNKLTELFKNGASHSRTVFKERKLLKEIVTGFENNEFEMHLQFIVDNKNEKIVSAETLSRWLNSAAQEKAHQR